MSERTATGASECEPRDEHGNPANGICMNCGAVMVENPMQPWCADCWDEGDDDD